MAKRKTRSNPRYQRETFRFANRPKVVGTIHNINQGAVDWFYSPEEARRRRDVVKRIAMVRKVRRYAVTAALLTASEDRRRFEPVPRGKIAQGPQDRPARTLYGVPKHRLLVKPLKASRSGRQRAPRSPIAVAHAVRFANPSKVAICVRRRIRREVIFANNKAAGAGKRRRTYFSGVSC